MQTAKQEKGESSLQESCSAAAIAALSASSMALCWVRFKSNVAQTEPQVTAREMIKLIKWSSMIKMKKTATVTSIFHGLRWDTLPQKTALTLKPPPVHWTQRRIFQANVVPERMLQNNCVSHMQGILRSRSTSSHYQMITRCWQNKTPMNGNLCFQKGLMLDEFYWAAPSEQNCIWGHHDIVTPTFGKLRRVGMVSLSLSVLLRIEEFWDFRGFGW